MIFFFSIIGFWGCEQENLFESQYDDYLELGSYEMLEMSEKDMETIGHAIQRLDVSMKNGLYQIKQSSGRQVNMSERLFEFVTDAYEHTNNISRPKSFNNLIPRLKSGNTENNDPEPSDTTYCVAHALAGMGGANFESVKALMDSLGYSQGVPPGALDSIVRQFYPNARKSTSSTQSGSLNNAVIYYQTSDTTGHAVNGLTQYGSGGSSAIMYWDSQNHKYGVITADSVKIIYYPY